VAGQRESRSGLASGAGWPAAKRAESPDPYSETVGRESIGHFAHEQEHPAL
jgi:hypothetical protein